MRRYAITFAAFWLATGCSKQNQPPTVANRPIDAASAQAKAAEFLDAAKLGPDSQGAEAFLSPEFRQRWNSPDAGTIGYFQYASWQAGDPVVDEKARTVTFSGRVQATKFVERRDITREGAAIVVYPTGGVAEFTLVMNRASSGELQVADFQFGTRAALAGIADVTDDDLKLALGGILSFPQPVLQGRTPKQLAEELSTSVWPIWYSGGPMRIGVKIEETGQQTIADKSLFSREDLRVSSDAEGRVCLSIRRWQSERMQEAFKQLGKESSTAGVAVNFWSRTRSYQTSIGLPFLWFHWKGATIKEERLTPELRVNEESPVLILIATETDAPKGMQPRQAKLTLTATKLPNR